MEITVLTDTKTWRLPSRKGIQRTANITVNQIVWFACILGAANEQPFWGIAAMSVYLVLYFRLITDDWVELRLIAIALVFGLIFDSTVIYLGIVEIIDPTAASLGEQPLWLTCLWINFSLLMRHGLNYFVARPRLGGAFGAVGGVLATWSAAKLGAIYLHINTATDMLFLALLWGSACYLLFKSASLTEALHDRHIDRPLATSVN